MQGRIAVGADIEERETCRTCYGNIGALFQNANRTGRKPAAFRRGGERQFAEPFSIRRIGEQELKRLHRRGWAKFGSVAPPELAGAGQAERLDILADRAASFGIVLDKEAIGCAARQRFKAKRTGAREKVEHARALDAEAFNPVREDI